MACPCCSKRKAKCRSRDVSCARDVSFPRAGHRSMDEKSSLESVRPYECISRNNTLRTDNRKTESRPCSTKSKCTSKICARRCTSKSKHQGEEKKSHSRTNHPSRHGKGASSCKVKTGTALGDDRKRSTCKPQRRCKEKEVLDHSVSALSTSVEPSDIASTISDTPPSVILDGQNITRFRHNNKSMAKPPHIRAHQLESALEYFDRRKKRVAALLPWTTVEPKAESTETSSHPADALTRQRLLELHRQGKVFFTPENTHDDNFILSFGMRNKIPIISNDLYRKEKNKQSTETEKLEMAAYLNKCRSSFKFDANGNFSLRGTLARCPHSRI